jgi:putative ABC transport system permease protein
VRRRLNPRVAGVRLSVLVHLYRVRLRSHAVQELLAGSGIAVGVALVLGVLVANQSLTGSAGQLVHQVVGSSRLQLDARSQLGYDERLALAARRLPGVSVAAPVLRENAEVSGPRGRYAVQLIGITPQAVRIGSVAGGRRVPGGARLAGGLLLPAAVASATGARAGGTVLVSAFGGARRIPVTSVLEGDGFGALASSPIAVTSLPAAQQLTGLRGRITQLYVEPRPGADAAVRRELAALAGPDLDVGPATRELGLLDQAARPNDRSTELFAAISVMVGFLLALNAMLLTVPERRRFVADLRIQGYDWRQIVVMLAFQAIVLGLLASIAGVVLGDLLSHVFLHRIPAYLTTAFPIGSQEILGTGTVALAIGCGVLATLLASLSPALDLRPGRPADAALHEREGGSEVIAPRTVNQLALAALASTAAIVALVLIEPGLTIAGGVALALSTLCAIPALFSLLARAPSCWRADAGACSYVSDDASRTGGASIRAAMDNRSAHHHR